MSCTMTDSQHCIVLNKYVLLESLGAGSFGSLFKGQNLRTKELVAIKMEVPGRGDLVKREARLYLHLQGTPGIPRVKWFGTWSGTHCMVLDLLGASLAQVRRAHGPFSQTQFVRVGLKMLDVLETLHAKGFVHRDVKPDNFLLGRENDDSQLFMVDLGFCVPWLDEGRPKTLRPLNGLVGSLNYASASAHQRRGLGPLDDLESMCYVMWFLSSPHGLPWSAIRNEATILEQKQVLQGAPPVIEQCIQFLRSREKPDYDTLRSMFANNLET